jgi:two-component system sensor histidine kinase BaeS
MKLIKKQSIRRRLSIILILCTILAVILTAFFVNVIMNDTFNKYVKNLQTQRNRRIVQYFQEIYKKEGHWNKASGEEIMHEAYMSNYCLTLLDKNRKVIWGMDPSDIKSDIKNHVMMQNTKGKGVYTSKTFDIKVSGNSVGYIMIGQYSSVILSQDDIDFKNSINKGIAFSSLISILIVIGVSLMISKQFSSPIKKVSDTSIKLSNGNYDTHLNIDSNIVEINNLISSMNMLSRKLQEQDLLRKRLVSDISHEIRTPLNVLQNNLEAMADGILPITTERLNSLNDEVVRFSRLLDNLNSLRQIEIQDIDLHIDKIDLKELLGSICEDFQTVAKDKNIDINILDNNKSYIIAGDKDKLRQVFINLISNSIKFNKIDGSVWVHLLKNKKNIIVEIRDNGIGIKQEDVPYIFERLYRGDRSRQKIKGKGIGLTIVKRILELHCATIEVESKADVGTNFTIYFNDDEIQKLSNCEK